MIHPTAHSPRRGDPGGVARRPQSGAPTVRVVHGGVQYREYLREEQRSQRGCIAGRMQLEFHHGLLAADCLDRTSVRYAPEDWTPAFSLVELLIRLPGGR